MMVPEKLMVCPFHVNFYWGGELLNWIPSSSFYQFLVVANVNRG
jgi:hypothetical protein